MSDDTNTPVIDELAILKDKAKVLGINAGNMGVDALRQKIAEKMAESQKSTEVVQPDEEMTALQRRQHLKREYLKLVRCRIFNNNPQKQDLQGELIIVGNKYLGMQKKMIPFGEPTENGYHIPLIIYNELKNRRYQSITVKGRAGKEEIVRKMLPEYTLEVMPPLTREELNELALTQAAALRVGV